METEAKANSRCCFLRENDRHRRRMELEDKAKVVASVRGAEFGQFLAALAVLPWSSLFEIKGQIHPIFPNRPRQNS